jgi:hypothetical protein
MAAAVPERAYLDLAKGPGLSRTLICEKVTRLLDGFLGRAWGSFDATEKFDPEIAVIRAFIEDAIYHPNCQWRRCPTDGFGQERTIRGARLLQRVNDRSRTPEIQVAEPFHQGEQQRHPTLMVVTLRQFIAYQIDTIHSVRVLIGIVEVARAKLVQRLPYFGQAIHI